MPARRPTRGLRLAASLAAIAAALFAWLWFGRWPGTEGALTITPPLDPAQRDYLAAFATSRRVMRDPQILVSVVDPLREAVHLPLGTDGAFFVADQSQEVAGPDVVDVNRPPGGQPSLYCNWTPTADGRALVWAGEDSFEAPSEWIGYLRASFLAPWQRELAGHVDWYTMEGAAVRVEIVNGQAILSELSLPHRVRALMRTVRAIVILGTRHMLGLPLKGG